MLLGIPEFAWVFGALAAFLIWELWRTGRPSRPEAPPPPADEPPREPAP